MLGLSSTMGGAQYHGSQWPYFLDWGYQMLFHLGSVLLFGIVVTFGQGSVSLGFLIGSRTVRVQIGCAISSWISSFGC